MRNSTEMAGKNVHVNGKNMCRVSTWHEFRSYLSQKFIVCLEVMFRLVSQMIAKPKNHIFSLALVPYENTQKRASVSLRSIFFSLVVDNIDAYSMSDRSFTYISWDLFAIWLFFIHTLPRTEDIIVNKWSQ